MEEKQSKKLAKVLSKLGLDEEKINEVFEVIEKEDDEEEEIVEEEKTDVVEQPAEEEVVKEDEEVSEVEETPVEEEQVEEEQPVELEVNEGEAEQVEEAQPVVEEEKPAEEVVQPEPVVDPVAQLQERLDEAQKVIDGFNARISSLEEELSKAGVLRAVEPKPAEEVGVDESSTETSKYASKSYDEILRNLNR